MFSVAHTVFICIIQGSLTSKDLACTSTNKHIDFDTILVRYQIFTQILIKVMASFIWSEWAGMWETDDIRGIIFLLILLLSNADVFANSQKRLQYYPIHPQSFDG